MTRIDAHQHFWTVARGDYGWLTPDLKPIYRDFGPDDLRPLLDEHNISGTVLVQAAETEAETEFMLSLAADNDFIKGVVGWVDFASEDAAASIKRMASDPLVVGLRPMIQEIRDVDWMLRDDLAPAFDALIEHDLTFDALTFPKHLPNLRELLARYADMRVVIDHGSKPLIKDRLIEGWKQDMAALAQDTSAYCKISGLVTEAAPDWNIDDLRPYVDHLLDCFGPERLIWGSDWPVATLASSYKRWVDTSAELLAGVSEAGRNAILGGNAARAYRLRP